MRRYYMAALEEDRCVWETKVGRRGETGRCMRAHVDGHLCTQHRKMADLWSCEYCGGNDEYPKDHCQDCARPTNPSTT